MHDNTTVGGTAVKEIAELAKAGQIVQTVEIGGETFTNVPVEDPRKPDPAPKPLIFHTLQGLVDFLVANRDVLPLGQCLLHVEGPETVSLVGKLSGHFQQRFSWATAVAPKPLEEQGLGFRFGQYLDLERFNVSLQALFADGWDKTTVLEVLGNIKLGGEIQREDDGVTQRVTTRAGVHMVDSRSVPNPVTLAPYRTFPEVEQPASRFVLRLKGDDERVGAALFEADGGLWRVVAVTTIAEWLGPRVPTELKVVA